MEEVNFILLYDDDLITSSILTMAVYESYPDSSVYQISTTIEAFDLIGKISDRDEALFGRQEICFIVDLNMRDHEGYAFINFLESNSFKCPVRVYIVDDENRKKRKSPSIAHIPIAETFSLPLDLYAVEEALKQSYPRYFYNLEGAVNVQ